MRINTSLAKLAILTLALLPTMAFAATAMTGPFAGFATTMLEWLAGPLGTGLAFTMVMVGAVAAVGGLGASGSVFNPTGWIMPFGLAFIIKIGPTIILSIMSQGAVV